MAWNFGQLAAGQHVRYTIDIDSQASTTSGWFTWDITDAGGGNLAIAYNGNYAGMGFSGTFTVGATTLVSDLPTKVSGDPMAGLTFLPLFTTPWQAYFGQAEWAVGKTWSYSGTGATITFSVTGTETYAGVEGYVGNWAATANGQTVTNDFCVSPDFPLALHCKIVGPDGSKLEYTLTEATGF